MRQKDKCNHCGNARHGLKNMPDDRNKSCSAWGKTCNSCQKTNHFSHMCKSGKNASIEADTADTADLKAIHSSQQTIGHFFSISAQQQSVSELSNACSSSTTLSPATDTDLIPIVASMQSWEGPATTLPLPHHVHNTISGWLPTRPRDSPTIMVQFSVDRPSYSQLGLNMPRFLSRGHNPGRTSNKPGICDSGAHLTDLQYLQCLPQQTHSCQTDTCGRSGWSFGRNCKFCPMLSNFSSDHQADF